VTERILYQFTLSPYCVKVRRILEYKDLDFATVEVNPFNRRQVRRLSGQTRVPVLVERAASDAGRGATVVADSTAIAAFLDRRYPGSPVYPADPGERARVAILEEWSDETFAGNLIPFKIFTPGNARRMVEQSKPFYPKHWYYEALYPLGPALLKGLNMRRRRGRSLASLRRDFLGDLDHLEGLAAAEPYLAGPRPTVFDFGVWGLLRTLEGLRGEELIASRPALASWYERLRALPPGS
jgi:glutathione S-transferase